MNERDSIITAYRQADFDKRLSLFLDCPWLREEFIQIDQKSEQPGRLQRRSAGPRWSPWSIGRVLAGLANRIAIR